MKYKPRFSIFEINLIFQILHDMMPCINLKLFKNEMYFPTMFPLVFAMNYKSDAQWSAGEDIF
jgi:hypothetical protein